MSAYIFRKGNRVFGGFESEFNGWTVF